jgi:hypothetical protein
MKNEIGKVEYHYGFYGAVHASYEPTKVKMQYLQEHELGDQPVRFDDRTGLSGYLLRKGFTSDSFADCDYIQIAEWAA